jgi:hypothetical protein
MAMQLCAIVSGGFLFGVSGIQCGENKHINGRRGACPDQSGRGKRRPFIIGCEIQLPKNRESPKPVTVSGFLNG